MYLTPTERERVLLWSVAEMARRRRGRGLRLNHPEAVALICDEVLERAREGASLPEAVRHASTVLTRDVLEGVPELADTIQVEAVFDDGSRLVTLHSPIR